MKELLDIEKQKPLIGVDSQVIKCPVCPLSFFGQSCGHALVLGSGTFGTVYSAKMFGTMVAVKKFVSDESTGLIAIFLLLT